MNKVIFLVWVRVKVRVRVVVGARFRIQVRDVYSVFIQDTLSSRVLVYRPSARASKGILHTNVLGVKDVFAHDYKIYCK